MDQVIEQTNEANEAGAGTARVKQLGPHAGAEIHGLDTGKPIGEGDRKLVHEALMEHGVIVFRNQDITREQQADFAANFGELTVHPFSPHLDDLPEMIVLDNDGTTRRFPPMSGTVTRCSGWNLPWAPCCGRKLFRGSVATPCSAI